MDRLFLKPPSGNRRSQSVNAISLDLKKDPHCCHVPVRSSTPARVVFQGYDESSFPELDFAEKLRALRELISSSKARRELKQLPSAKVPGRVIAKRLSSLSFPEVQEVDNKIRFTANSSTRRELSDKERINMNVPSADCVLSNRYDYECDSVPNLEKEMLSVYRSSPVVTENYKNLSFVEHSSSSAFPSRGSKLSSHSPVMEVLTDDCAKIRGLRQQASSSLGFQYPYHDIFEVPERDWNNLKTLQGGQSLHRDENERSIATGGDLQSPLLSVEENRYGIDGLYTTGAVDFAANINETDINISTEREGSRPQQNDCTFAEFKKNKQTNLQILDKSCLAAKWQQSQAHCQESHSKNSNTNLGEIEHWTQVLSQKRNRAERTCFSAPCSPAPQQTNVPLDSTYLSLLSSHLQQSSPTQNTLDRDGSTESKLDLSLQKPQQALYSIGKKSLKKENTFERVGRASDPDPKDKLQDAEVAAITRQSQVKKIISRKGVSARVQKECISQEVNQTAANVQPTSIVHESQKSRHLAEEASKTGVSLQSQQHVQHGDCSSENVEHIPSDRYHNPTAFLVPKDDHIITLNKLKALLKSRKSELRSDSRGSSASTSSPSPLKAFHSNCHHYDRLQVSSSDQAQVDGLGEHDLVSSRDMKGIVVQATHRTASRKLIKRPPAGSKPNLSKNVVKQRNFRNIEAPLFQNHGVSNHSIQDSSTMKSSCRSDSRLLERPLSAPHSYNTQQPKLERSSTPEVPHRNGACKPHTTRTMSSRSDRDLNPPGNNQGQSQNNARRKSVTDLTSKEMGGDFASAHRLRKNIQRLHQEISTRMDQEEYILQDLMSKASNNDKTSGSSSVNMIKNDAKEIRRRLSFDGGIIGSDTEECQERKEVKDESSDFIPKKLQSEAGKPQTFPAAGTSCTDMEMLTRSLMTRPATALKDDDESTVLADRFANSAKVAKMASIMKPSFSNSDTVKDIRQDSSHLHQTNRAGNRFPQDEYSKNCLKDNLRQDELKGFLREHLATNSSGRIQHVNSSTVSEDFGFQTEQMPLSNTRPLSSPRNNFQSLASTRAQGFDSKKIILSQLGNIKMVNLLQRLYSADAKTRRVIILQAQYFKHWQNTAHIRKRQRQIYEESLRRAQFYVVHKLQHRYFRQWHTAAEEHHKTKSADTIHRRHMLQKGLQAFQWAILQSKHQSNTLKQRVQAITVRAAFTKWQTLATSRREHRLRTTFVRWQEYTKEEKIICRMQRNLNGKLIYQAMVTWKCVYYRKVKENIAEHHIRLTRLKHAWHAWRTFAQVSKDKTRSLQLAMFSQPSHVIIHGLQKCSIIYMTVVRTCETARSLQRHNTQRTSLHIMIRAWHQSKKARHHFRTKWLAFILHQWHQGTQISQAEHQHDMVVSQEHWHKSITKHFFYNWLQKLFLQKALRFAHKFLYRSAFHHWHTEWQNNMQHLQEVTAAVISNRLRRCLLMWRRNVVDQRRRQKQAVVLVERCLLRSALSSWWQYTVFKMSFRITLQQHLKKIQRVTINCCFSVWKKSLFQRLDEKHKHELWSLSCVRKMAGHWRHVCHLRHLQSILQNTEPDRQLGLLRCVFIKWKAAKRKADKETAEVVASQHVLQYCAMQRRFQEWRLAARRVLLIKPIILNKERLLLNWYFDAWHGYIQRRRQRQHSKKEFEQNQLARVFALWRRQQECQQLARWSQQQFTQRLVLCLLCEWHAIIHRKHLAYHFHNNSLLVSFFTLWTSRSKKQQHQRAVHLAKQTLNQRLKRYYFECWLSEMYKQMAVTDTAVVHLKQQQAQNCLRKAFFRWRRSLHVHLTSRAYQHSADQRRLRTLLLEWHTVTSCSLSEAVQHFALQLGLKPQEETAMGNAELTSFEDGKDTEDHNTGQVGCLGKLQVYRLASHSDLSDEASLKSADGLENTEECYSRKQKMQEIAVVFVTRLAHWPASLAFSLWWDYTQNQHHLRLLAQQAYAVHCSAMMSHTLKLWRLQLMGIQRATAFRNKQLLQKAMKGLIKNSQLQKAKALLVVKSRGHLVKHVLSKVFPYWVTKAQEQQYQRNIIHLWTSVTPEEAQLLPLEMTLNRQLRQRCLNLYFNVWKFNFLFLFKLKNAYHKYLLSRVVSAWHEWARIRQGEEHRKQDFLHTRIMSLVFRTWCRRLHQKQETERRYQTARQTRLHCIFQSWQAWAHESRKHKVAQQILKKRLDKERLISNFSVWRQLTNRLHLAYKVQRIRLIHRVLCCWQKVVFKKRQQHQVIFTFQVQCITHLVKRLFRQWQDRFHHQIKAYKQRQELAQQCALWCGRKWHRKAQNTRGCKLIEVFKYNRLMTSFSRWRSALNHVQELEQREEKYVKEKNKVLMEHFMGEWQQHLKSAIMSRSFFCKLQITILEAWHAHSKASRDRCIRGVALERALQEQNLRSYFLYWQSLTQRAHSLQNSVELKLQMKVFQAWRFMARKRTSQRMLVAKFGRQHQYRLMNAAFMTMRCRFDYCQGLQDTGDGICEARNVVLIRRALRRWKDQLDELLASRFYVQLLAMRTARKWHQFVLHVKSERQHEMEQQHRAVVHHSKHICRLVFKALRREVKVSRNRQLHRQRCASRCAWKWKHATDLSVTACVMEKEILIASYWRTWRLGWIRQQAVARNEAAEKQQILSQVFSAWRSLCPSHSHCVMQASGRGKAGRPASPGKEHISTHMPRSLLPVPVGSVRQSTLESFSC